MVKHIKEFHAKNKKDNSLQAETIPFPEELIESIVLSAVVQGGSIEQQTLVVLHELGEKLEFCDEDEETTILFEHKLQKKDSLYRNNEKSNKE